MKVDFPRHTPVSPDQLHANETLAKQLFVEGYPTYVLLNPQGKNQGGRWAIAKAGRLL